MMYTLTPPGEYDKSIFAATAMPPYASITEAICYVFTFIDFNGVIQVRIYCLNLFYLYLKII